MSIAFSETTVPFQGENLNGNFGLRDVNLENRSGYNSKAECIQQKNFSEGDSFRVDVPTGRQHCSGHDGNGDCHSIMEPKHFTCVNGRWAN